MNCPDCRSADTIYDFECATWFCRSCQLPFTPLASREIIEHVPASEYDCFSAIQEARNGSVWIAQEEPGEDEVFIEITELESEESTAVHLNANELERLIQILEMALNTLLNQQK